MAASTRAIEIIRGTLFVKVVSGANLPSGDLIGKGDPYVKMTIGSQELKTTVKKGSDPLWGSDKDQHHFKVANETDPIQLAVWDWDRVTKDDLVAKGSFKLSDLDPKKVQNGMELVVPVEGKKKKSKEPSVTLFLEYTPLTVADGPGGGVERREGVMTMTLVRAEGLMKGPGEHSGMLTGIDPYIIVGLGDSTFRSCTKFKSKNPTWNEKARFVLPRGHHWKSLRLTVCDKDFVSQDDRISEATESIEKLIQGEGEIRVTLSPAENRHKTDAALADKQDMGTVVLRADFVPLEVEEQRFFLQMFEQVDVNGDGTLGMDEWKMLIQGVGRMKVQGSDITTPTEKVSVEVAEQLFKQADTDNSGSVDKKEMAFHMGKRPVVKDMEIQIEPHLFKAWLNTALDREPLEKLMGGGDSHTVDTAHHGHGVFGIFSDWNTDQASFGKGLNVGEKAEHILVQNRVTGIVEEEVIDPSINKAMRLLYQSAFGDLIRKAPSTDALFKKMSVAQGAKYDSPHSKDHIVSFAHNFNLDLTECAKDVKEYATFNEFFYRKLKPGARVIDKQDDIWAACQPCDCRLNVFPTVSKAKELWVKGDNFTIPELLGFSHLPDMAYVDKYKDKFEGASLSIHRLAPQDYHRFHVPCDCIVKERVFLEGKLWTVNPVAVNKVDVFTANKRYVTMLETEQFGTIAYVSIGAHMVGGIVFTKNSGERIKKGEELGYFKFGGSTVVCVWQQGAIKFDADLLQVSDSSTEMLVALGEGLGEAGGKIPAELCVAD